MNYERLFNEDVIEKKRIARGVRNRASRKGYTGAVKFPSDYLKGKTLKDYKKESEVKTYMLIPDYSKFTNLKKEEKKKTLNDLLQNYSRVAIADKWNINKKTIDNIVFRLGLSKKRDSKVEDNKQENKVEMVEKNVGYHNNYKPDLNTQHQEIKTKTEESFEASGFVFKAIIEGEKHRTTERVYKVLDFLEPDTQYEVLIVVKKKSTIFAGR